MITKALGKSADDTGYAAKQAHVELAMRMKKVGGWVNACIVSLFSLSE